MPFRGGHGRTPGATDPRQGKARGETYMKQRASGLIVFRSSCCSWWLSTSLAYSYSIQDYSIGG